MNTETVMQAVLDALAGKTVCTLEDITLKLPSPMEPADVILALKTLKAFGKITFPDRGRNARSQYALVKEHTETVPQTPEPTVLAPEPEVSPETTPDVEVLIPTIPEARPMDPGEGYFGDAYLTRLAANATPCFGSWSARAKTCDGCALRHECREAAIAELYTMASRAAFTPASSPPIVQEIPAVEPAPEEPEQLAPFTVICTKCSGAIQAGEPIKHVVHKGIFHITCV